MPMKRYPLTQSWSAVLTDWEDALKVAGRSPATIETRSEHLRRFARQTGAPGPGLVSRGRLTSWAAGQEWKAETRRSFYASLRGFYRWALETGTVADDITDVLPTVKPAPPLPRPAPERAYLEALAAADERGHIILRLAGEGGLRRAEIARIGRADLIEDLTGWTLIVHGKGAKDRYVPLTDTLAREICRFMGRREWLFPSPIGGHLTPRHIGKIGSRAIPEGYTLHTLRHRFATGLVVKGADLLTVQQLLGHASVATTQRYVRLPDDALRRAVNLLSA